MNDTDDYLNLPKFHLHNIVDCNHNTPELFNHTYGEFKAFYIKDILYCYIPIPKCATQDTQRALWEHPEVVSAVEFSPEDIQKARWFCGHREIHQRLGSAYVSWSNHVSTKGISPTIPLNDVLKRPELWDEHIYPQESFLQIFDDNHITYTKLEVDSNNPELYSNSLSNFLNIDITIGK